MSKKAEFSGFDDGWLDVGFGDSIGSQEIHGVGEGCTNEEEWV